MGRIALVPGSTREPRHQFLDWPSAQSGLGQATHQAVGLPYPTLRIEPGGTTGGYAWRTFTFDAGRTCIVLRMLFEFEPGFLSGSNGHMVEFLSASDAVIARYTVTTSGARTTQVRTGGSLVTPYVTGGAALGRGLMQELWIGWQAATSGSSNDGQWLVWGATGTYAIQRDWLNNDGTSPAEQVLKIRVGWLATGTNPGGANLHIHEVEVWDSQPTDLEVIYPTAGAQYFEDTPALVAFTAPSGLPINQLTYANNGGAPTALTVIDTTGERTDATLNSDAVNDNGEVSASLFTNTEGTYDGCMVDASYGAGRLMPPSQILWQRSAASNYKAYLHPMHALAVAPPGKRGTLSLRTSDTAGELTLESGHGIGTGHTIYLYWAAGGGGKRLAVTVGTVSSNVVPVSGGTGDSLPGQGVAVYVAYNNAALAMIATPQRFRVWNVKEWPAGAGRYVVALPPSVMVAGALTVSLTLGPTTYTRTVAVQKARPRTLRSALPAGQRITVGCDDGLPTQFAFQRQVFATRSLRPYCAVIVGGNGHKNVASWGQQRLLRACGWNLVPHFWDGLTLLSHAKAVGVRIIRLTCAALRMQGETDCDWMFVTPSGQAAAADDSEILDEILLRVRLARGSTAGALNNQPLNLTAAQLASNSLYNGGYNGASPGEWAAAWLAAKLAGIGSHALVSFQLHEFGPIHTATLTVRRGNSVGELTLPAGHVIAANGTLALLWPAGNRTGYSGPVSGTSVSVGEYYATVQSGGGTSSGNLTLPSGHAVQTGHTLSLAWNGGGRASVTAGTVSGTTVPISGGSGDNLPANGQALAVGRESGSSGSNLPSQGSPVYIGYSTHTDPGLVAAILDAAAAAGITPQRLKDYLLQPGGGRARCFGPGIRMHS